MCASRLRSSAHDRCSCHLTRSVSPATEQARLPPSAAAIPLVRRFGTHATCNSSSSSRREAVSEMQVGARAKRPIDGRHCRGHRYQSVLLFHLSVLLAAATFFAFSHSAVRQVCSPPNFSRKPGGVRRLDMQHMCVPSSTRGKSTRPLPPFPASIHSSMQAATHASRLPPAAASAVPAFRPRELFSLMASSHAAAVRPSWRAHDEAGRHLASWLLLRLPATRDFPRSSLPLEEPGAPPSPPRCINHSIHIPSAPSAAPSSSSRAPDSTQLRFPPVF